MNVGTNGKYKHVCPRNCASSCTLFSSIENDTIQRITGDITHPYTNGKLCAKGFTYKELNEHQDRLKYPYYQNGKGSGKFTQISWQKAYEMITNEMLKIQTKHSSFRPLAFYKGSGNIGIHHYVADEFFTNIDATKVTGISTMLNNRKNGQFIQSFEPSTLFHSSMIIIWGANPAATNIHLIPFLINAKLQGTKIVVIDPIRTKTANLADLFIQLRPNSDQALVHLLTKLTIEKQAYDQKFATQHKESFDELSNAVQQLQMDDLLPQCDIPEEAQSKLLDWLLEAGDISYILGSGLEKHHNGMETIQAIRTFSALRGDHQNNGTGIMMKNWDFPLFNNQLHGVEKAIRTNDIPILLSSEETTIDMLWITGGNPLIQEAHPKVFKQWMENIPFVVTVDHFMTPTASMSDLVLPTTTFFEEMDIVLSPWHDAIALNEKAVSPFYECRSEWRIMTDLTKKLQSYSKEVCSFPIYANEEQYLNAQFNEQVEERYSIKNIQDLREKDGLTSSAGKRWAKGWKTGEKETLPFHLPFIAGEQEKESHEDWNQTNEYPFWLLTPHHPFKLNSQFHYLQLSDVGEAALEVNPTIAKELNIKNGEIITVFNERASMEIKAIYNAFLPKDIVMFYQGWYPDSSETINDFIHEWEGNEPFRSIPLYNTFVGVKKL
ncbi:molybdopterin-dependent oxidoreductase [Bacillus sp. B15-48]|uniref:molybdopterin-containing oxidoreductase family protein n=1 Tax=Bacillus sp. B15-48 TaxID=1548601 RepID=UPI00193FBEAB|nr:molybdopterin-dependent oxidoreductase [Bacillus sp. B15-48]MBM4765348.1 molybdopterin-dependent oxidoreductase [Bacillus sp. B15-48]